MSASSVHQGLGTESRVVLAIHVPNRLSSRAIDEAVAMAASRLKCLLGEHYRKQIHHRVSTRRRAGVTA